MNKLFYFWKVTVITFLTVDTPLELGGWGTVFHSSFNETTAFWGFLLPAIVTFGVMSMTYLNSGDLK